VKHQKSEADYALIECVPLPERVGHWKNDPCYRLTPFPTRTTMTLKWSARRLNMGAWTHVSNCLVQKRKNDEKGK
jgi:hypothetical protein